MATKAPATRVPFACKPRPFVLVLPIGPLYSKES
jgi:hypothetical protein